MGMANIRRAIEDREAMVESVTSKGYEPDMEGELDRLKPAYKMDE